LPTDDADAYEQIVGTGGHDFINRVTTHSWSDGGAAAAAALSWIARDANSTDAQTAERAGRAARVIAAYLADDQEKLTKALRGHNPELVAGYSLILSPFQGALVADGSGIRGFEPLDDYGDYSRARGIFTVIGSDTAASQAFTATAYQRVETYLRDFGAKAATGDVSGAVKVTYAAALSGIVDGAAHASGNADIETRNAKQAVDFASYVVADALRPHPGVDLDVTFFSSDGRLVAPDQVARDDKADYSSQLQRYLTGRPPVWGVLKDFNTQFNQGAGIT
jgi:hypothetical protein